MIIRSSLLLSTLDITVEMDDPFTRMSQNFFSFLSQIKQRGYVIATTQALSFSFFPPFSTTLVCVCSTVLLEFPNHPQEFPNLPTPMVSEAISETARLRSSRGQVKICINDLKSLVQSRFIPNKRMAIGPWSPINFRSP